MTLSRIGATYCAILAPSRHAPSESTSTNCRVATRLVQEQKLVGNEHKPRLTVMQKYFFDMKDGVPLRDRIGMEFKNNADAIAHCVVLAEHFYRDSLTDDQDLEIDR